MCVLLTINSAIFDLVLTSYHTLLMFLCSLKLGSNQQQTMLNLGLGNFASLGSIDMIRLTIAFHSGGVLLAVNRKFK